MLKFLCLYKPNGEYYRHLGFANALRQCGHKFAFWNPQEKPAHDIFNEYEPDIFIGTTFDLDRATINCIKSRPKLKVILKGGNWGTNDHEIDKSKYAILFVQDKEKPLLEQLKKETGRPDFVFCHYHPNRVEETMSGWREIGIEPLGIMNAADVIDYGQGTKRPSLMCDVGFVGGYWPYKAQNLDKYIVPLCFPYGKLNIKIFGNQKWHVPQWLGLCDNATTRDLYASALISPNISEPHSNMFGFDVVERPFKIISSGGFLLMDYVESAVNDVFGDSVETFKDQKEFAEKLVHYLKNPDARDMSKAKKIVYEGHTYHHRMSYLLDKLGFEAEAKGLLVGLIKCL